MQLRNYVLVTAGYWAFTLTDGALRMLVLLHFHELGYSPVQLAFLFLLYEVMGIVTNLLGGWVGSRTGLNRTLIAGLALQVVAECQKAGGTAAFVDAEHALDPTYAEKLGVEINDLLVSQPDTGEQALEIADMLVRSGAVDLVVHLPAALFGLGYAYELQQKWEEARNNYGTAMVLQDGQFTEAAPLPEPERQETLTEVAGRTGAQPRPQAVRPVVTPPRADDYSDLLSAQRQPFRNIDLAGEIQQVFLAQGVAGMQLAQGTSSDRVLLEITTDSEASVFRALEVAADALLHVRTRTTAPVSAFELVLVTSNLTRGGQFLMTPAAASTAARGIRT